MPRPTAPRVLLVEDDHDTAELISEWVNRHFGCACTTRCGSIADIAGHDLAHVDMVMSDYNLPDGTGLDVLAHVQGRREDLPVILVTGVREVNTAVDAIRRGAYDYVMKVGDFGRTIPVVIEKNLEVARIRRDNLRLQAALATSLAELKRKNRELEDAAARFERMASTDLLTGLANRRRLEQRLHVMFSEALRYAGDLACLMIDLDGFKATNDTLGHQKGDDLLALTGRIINEQIRISDIGARYGGDEFVIALPHTPHETAVALARRLSAEFQRQGAAMLGEDMRCGMSIGVSSVALSKPLDPLQLIAHADAALYTAKMSGRARIMVCSADGATALAPEKIAA